MQQSTRLKFMAAVAESIAKCSSSKSTGPLSAESLTKSDLHKATCAQRRAQSKQLARWQSDLRSDLLLETLNDATFVAVAQGASQPSDRLMHFNVMMMMTCALSRVTCAKQPEQSGLRKALCTVGLAQSSLHKVSCGVTCAK